jgi:hypothetical protein
MSLCRWLFPSFGAWLLVLGLALVVLPGGIWRRLWGLQMAAMGWYFISLSCTQHSELKRFFVRTRWLLLGAQTLWGAWQHLPVWLWALLGMESLWLLSVSMASLVTEGVVGKQGQTVAKEHPALVTSSGPSMPGWVHNLVLGMVPLSEGLGCVFAVQLYGPFGLGVPVSIGDPYAIYFGMHALYLAAVWAATSLYRCPEVMSATMVGRLGVALAFGMFHVFGLVPPAAHFKWLVPLLVASVGWTFIEVNYPNWLPKWVRSAGSDSDYSVP